MSTRKKYVLLLSVILIAIIIFIIIYANSRANESEKETTLSAGDKNYSQNNITQNELTESLDISSTQWITENTTIQNTTQNTTQKATQKVTQNTTQATQNNTASTTGSAGSSDASFAQQVVNLVNSERAKAGLSPVSVSGSLASAALVRAQEIVTIFSHTRPNGSAFNTALSENGVNYSGAGENIAWGQQTPEQVMEGWMNSSGHRANILNPSFTAIGVGHYQNGGKNYWTQLFIY